MYAPATLPVSLRRPPAKARTQGIEWGVMMTHGPGHGPGGIHATLCLQVAGRAVLRASQGHQAASASAPTPPPAAGLQPPAPAFIAHRCGADDEVLPAPAPCCVRVHTHMYCIVRAHAGYPLPQRAAACCRWGVGRCAAARLQLLPLLLLPSCVHVHALLCVCVRAGCGPKAMPSTARMRRRWDLLSRCCDALLMVSGGYATPCSACTLAAVVTPQ